jgi:hypothetical protein
MKRFTLLVAFLLSTLTADLMAQSEEDIAPFPLGPIGGTAYQKTGSSLLRVTEITAGGPGAAAGLRVGDFIYGADNGRLPAMGPVHADGWRGAVSELGYAIERPESAGGALTLQILRPDTGNLSLNLTLPQKTAWRPSYPVGDSRMETLWLSQLDSILLSWGISGLEARWPHRLEACATGNLTK